MQAGDVSTTRRLGSILRTRGQRVTRQRVLVLAALAELGGHQTVEQVYAWVRARDATIHLSTIYRVLAFGVRLGLVAEADAEGKRAFELQHIGRHHHLRCLSCGHILECDDALLDPLRAAIAQRYSFAVQLDHLVIPGVCHVCQQSHSQNREWAASGRSAISACAETSGVTVTGHRREKGRSRQQ